jgi:phosphatidylserine/phosphatidylglycerophosphate/cardiolipin synthase-like enzyme
MPIADPMRGNAAGSMTESMPTSPRRRPRRTTPPIDREELPQLSRMTRSRAGGNERSRVAAPEALERVAKRLQIVDRDGSESSRNSAAPLDVVMPVRGVALELIAGRGHYERVIAAVTNAHTSVWIATANVKELMIEDGRARPGRRRSMRRSSYVSILAVLDDLAMRGVELRLLHAEIPSRPFREELANHPRLVGGGLALRRCPRVHMKAVVVDGSLLYLGSANWTGAGLGAKGSGRRNFELGIVTDDAPLLDQVQAIYERVWTGAECVACKLRAECPGPLSELAEASRTVDAAPSPLPKRSQIRRRNRPRLL